MAKQKLHIALPEYVLNQLNAEAELRGQTGADLAAFFVSYMMEMKGMLPTLIKKKLTILWQS